jgi:hypothetical protein
MMDTLNESPVEQSVQESDFSILRSESAEMLSKYLRALCSFFGVQNYPISESELSDILVRDWSQDLRIGSETVLQCTRFALAQIEEESDGITDALNIDGEGFADWCANENLQASKDSDRNSAACELAEVLCGIHSVLEREQMNGKVSLYTFSSFRSLIESQISSSSTKRLLLESSPKQSPTYLNELMNMPRSPLISERDTEEVLSIIAGLADLLAYLKIIQEALASDRPLKHTLPFFSLINQEARRLLQDVEVFAMRVETSNEELFNILDGMKFAVSMELRKVFSFELVGLSSMRQAPSIYARVENAHGLLRDSFQQSIVGLSKIFDPEIEGARLFSAFRTKVEQSLELRSDLFALLQLVRKAEKERDLYPIARLIERLGAFHSSSLRYLMFKDWEACERFIEEVGAARGAIELSPVLNRFSAYLETLLGQVNMRAVLIDHPFEYPAPDV